MGDFQHQQEGANQDELQVRNQPEEVEDAATAQVRSMLSSHDPQTVKDIGEIIRNNPQSRNAIYALLHKTRGNRFVTQVEQFIAPEDGPARFAAPSAEGKADAMVGFRAANGTNRGIRPEVDAQELRANADGNAPQSAPITDPAKASAAADEMNANEAELGVGSSAKAPEKKPAGLTKAQTEANMMEVDDMDATPLVVGKQDEAKVAKDETVIGASSEVKAPEIVKQTEVLKDPDQKADEPQKAADVAKDDDGENEAVGGTKPDIGPVKVTASVLRVRSTPTIGRDNILGRLMRNQVVEAVGHQGDWVEINYRGQTAFIHSSFVVGALEAPAAKTAEPPTAATAT